MKYIRLAAKKTKNKLRPALDKAGETLADILCPKKCIVCNCLTPIGRKEALCDDCKKTIGDSSAVIIEPDSCHEEVIGALPYRDNVRSSMIRFKFNSRKYLGTAFGYSIEELIKDRDFLQSFHIICPVPIHHLRQREYNQSAVIGSYLAKKLNLELCPDMLLKVNNLVPLSSMGYSMRRIMIEGAIDFNLKYDIFGKNILLLDDIYTSGSTANECSKVLKMYGAAKVIVLAACHNEFEFEGGKTHGDAALGNH